MYSNVDERIKRSFQILNQFGVAIPFPDDASQFSVHSNNSYQKLSQNDSATDEIKKTRPTTRLLGNRHPEALD